MNDWPRPEHDAERASPELKEETLAAILEDLAARWDAGEPIDIEAVCRQYPELADEIRACAASLHFLRMVRSSCDGSSGDRTELAPGERFADYQIVRELGRGGMGTVYEARHLLLDRLVALKVLSGPSVRLEQARRRFLREARTAANLHHTNIVPIFDVGEADGVCYYAMQLIHGDPLDDVIDALRAAEQLRSQRTRSIGDAQSLSDVEEDASPVADPEKRRSVLTRLKAFPDLLAGIQTTAYYRAIAQLIAQVARALDYAHRRGVIHRDIKPSNLLLDPQGILWISDFGLALRTEGFQFDSNHSAARDLVGTPQYMSPEQVLPKGRTLDHRVDIYSLGATLYELATLRPMIDGPNTLSILAAIVSERPPAPREVNPFVPRDLDAIIRKATAKDPDQRYRSAAEFAEDLERFARWEPTVARPLGPAGRLVRWCRRQPLLATVIAAAIVSVTTVAAVAYRRVERERDQAVAAQRAAERAAETAEQERRRAQDRLWQALYQQARATRATRSPGRRSRALELLRQAAALRFSPELRDEAVAAMAAADACSLAETSFEGRATVVRYSERGDELLVAEERRDGTILHVGPSLPPKLKPLATLNGSVADAAFRSDGSVLAVVRRIIWSENQEDGRPRPQKVLLELWDSRTGDTYGLSDTFEAVRTVLIVPGAEEVIAAAPRPGVVGLFAVARGGLELVRQFELGPYDAITLGPDRKRQLTVLDREGNVAIWDYRAGKAEGAPWGQVVAPERRRLIRWDHSGRFLAVGGRYGTVAVWSLDRQEPLYVLSGHRGPINNLAFSPNQELLVTTSLLDLRVRVWRMTSGQELLTLRGLNAPALSVCFNPDGSTLAAASFQGRLIQWRLDAASVVHEYNVMAGPFISADYSDDGRTLVVASRMGRIALVDRSGRTVLEEFSPGESPRAWLWCWLVQYGPDGRVCWFNGDGSIWLWDYRQHQPPKRLIPRGRTVRYGSRRMALLPEGYLVRALAHRLETWRYGGEATGIVDEVRVEGGVILAIAAHESTVAAAIDDQAQPRVMTYRVHDGRLIPTGSVSIPRRLIRLVMLSDAEAVVGLWDGRVLRVNVQDGTQRTLTQGSGPVTALAVDAGRRRLAVAYENGSVEIWATEQNELLYRLPTGYSGPVSELRFSPDGHSLLVCGYYLTEWDLRRIEQSLRSMALGWRRQ